MRITHFVPLIAVSVSLSAAAQSGRGTVTGTISDAQGIAIQGVRVTLSPGGATALTDSIGQYTFIGVDSGSYTLSTGYTGFASSSQSITVPAGGNARADLSLRINSASQSVDVYSGREGGEIEAINRTLNADNIINVLPADVIISLPNANIADAIGRLASVSLERDEGEGKYVQIRGTEPRLTHTTLDGVTIASPETVRQIKLDLIPADLVESVQINKTLQANMEGDGIGGSVDIRTKSAEHLPTLNFEALGGYSPILQGRGNDQFDGTLGKRFLEGDKLGILFAGSYDFNGRGINDVEPGPALSGTYDLRDYEYFRDRRGFAGTIDYRFSETSSVYLKGLYSHFNNFGDDYIYSPTINSFADATTLTQGGTDGTVTFSALRRRPIQDIGGLQFGGRHVLKSSLLAYDINSSIGRTRDGGYGTAHFGPSDPNNPLNKIQYNLDVSDPNNPKLNVQNGVNIFDTTHLFYQGQTLQYFYNPEVDLGFGGSLATSYTSHSHTGSFEFGGRFRNEHKFVNQNTHNYTPNASNPEDPSLAMTNFVNDFSDPNYYGGHRKFGPGVDYGKVLSFTGQTDSSDILGNNFNQIEKVSAGYLMNTIDLGRFRINTGVRIEATNENNLGYIGVDRRTGNITNLTGKPTKNVGSYIDVLPSASVRYALTPAQGLRVVYGRGISRPNFSDLVPFQTASNTGSRGRNTVSVGNPGLKSEYADDIDLLYENSLPRAGLLQSGFFYKHISNPLVSVQTRLPASDPNYPNFLSTQTINAGSGYVYGFEISFQQHFTYLPGLLSGFGLSTNYGYTKSRATLPPFISPSALAPGQISGPNRGASGANPPLLRQAPNTFNFSPTYDRKALSVRLGVSYNQANIYSYGYNDSNAGPITQGGGGGGLYGPNGDTYLYSHTQVDLQGTYKLRKGFQLVAYGLNLTNEVFGFYQGAEIYPIQREYYRQTFGGGLRWNYARNR